MKKPGAVSRAGCSTDWRNKKPIAGQARDRRAIHQFQFHE
jgi:hypothetical protein